MSSNGVDEESLSQESKLHKNNTLIPLSPEPMLSSLLGAFRQKSQALISWINLIIKNG